LSLAPLLRRHGLHLDGGRTASVVTPSRTAAMASSPDVLIIGSGIGGGTLAYRLVQHGLSVTILERGGFLPQEPQNWDVNAVFFDQKYVPEETWLDKGGTPFRPGTYYYVGGSSKLYGGAMLRLRERDFENLEHVDGSRPPGRSAIVNSRLTMISRKNSISCMVRL